MALEHLEESQERYSQLAGWLNLDMHTVEYPTEKLMLINWQVQKNQKTMKASGTVPSTCMLYLKQRMRENPRGKGRRFMENDLVLLKVWANGGAV